MGREIRMVPADWQHPKDQRGQYIPLYDGIQFRRDIASWEKHRDGSRPDPRDYMPDWPAEQRTHLCMYENTTEGTPISPAFATPEECARWLADNKASAFGDLTATYEEWLAACRRGYAVSLVAGAGLPLRSGVAASVDP